MYLYMYPGLVLHRHTSPQKPSASTHKCVRKAVSKRSTLAARGRHFICSI